MKSRHRYGRPRPSTPTESVTRARQKGNPAFKAGKTGWMGTHEHWLPQLIATANKYDAAGSKFLEGHVLAHLVGDRIYAEINPHRSESGGHQIVPVFVFRPAAAADALAR